MVQPILIALLALMALPCSAARPKRAASLDGRTIGSIKIETFNVFNTDVYPESKAGYRMANALHRTTRENVVRRELLFAVGQPYDSNLARETERNLRLLPIIRRASADAVVNSSGTVDVVVRTYDAWSLEIVANYKRVGGVTEYKGGLTEHNLLGSGNSLAFVYDQDGASPSKSVSWTDTAFLQRHHLNLTLTAYSWPDAKNYAFVLDSPFYASITRVAGGLTGNYNEKNIPVYAAEIQTGEALRRAAELGVSYGVAVATSTTRTRRVRAGLLNRHVDFLPLPNTAPSTLPAKEQYVFLQLGAEYQELDFVTVRRIQKFTRDEDYNLGWGVFPTLSWAPPVRALNGAESQALPGLMVRKGFSWDESLLLFRASYTTAFLNGANSSRVAGGDALCFVSGLPRQTLAAHAAYDHGWRLDPASRLTLGENNGLRGYGLSQFTGERRLLLNLEDRIFLADEWLRLLDVGAVVFYDSGYAWGPGARTRLRDLRHSAGFGLRLAASRSGGNTPVRVDFARALNPNGTNSRWTVSVIAGHAFGPD